MAKYFMLWLFVLSIDFPAIAQKNNDYVADLMTKRVLTCDDIGYNAALLVPTMYGEKKTDTLDAVMTYWERNCGLSEPAASFSIMYAIQQNTFNKQLATASHCNNFTDAAIADTAYFNKNIIANLHSYKYVFDNSPLNDSNSDDLTKAYLHYYDLIYDIATSLLTATDLSPVESFLVHYYNNPDSTKIEDLSSARYGGTFIQQSYLKQKSAQNSLNGVDYALTAGTWTPTGNLSVLATAPYLGFLIGGRRNKWTFDFDCSIAFPLGNTQTYQVSNHDSLSPSNTFIAFYLGLDANYTLLHKNNSEFNLLMGLGYQGIQVLNGQDNSAVLTISSVNPNLGLGYKLFLKHKIKNDRGGANSYVVHHSYIGIQAKYDFLFFNNNPGTSLSGNAFTIGIIYGGTLKSGKYSN